MKEAAGLVAGPAHYPLMPEEPCRGGFSEEHTRPEVVAPLTAAMHLIHSNASQAPGLISLLQLGHEHFALCNLLRGHINQFQLGIPLHHFHVDPLHVFLFKTKGGSRR